MDHSEPTLQADLGRRSESLLRVAADLATLFKTHVIGTAACQSMLVSYGDGNMSGDAIGQDRAKIDREAEVAGTRCRAASLVAGVFAHSPAQPWLPGGITRDSLWQPGRCTPVSH